jgi:hypothetical protein
MIRSFLIQKSLLMSTFELHPSDDALRDLREVSTFQADEGQLVGRDPREVSSATLALYHREKNPLKALRARCLDCCCGVASEVRKCTAVNCPSWPFRMGTNPFREKRVLSVAQKAVLAERLAKA